MTKFSLFSFIKLTLGLVMSICLLTTAVRAHETNPTIADLTVENGELTMSMRLNVEAFLAGVDLSAVEDTDEAPEAEAYDVLHAKPAGEIEAMFREGVDEFLSGVEIQVDGAKVPLSLDNIQVSEESPEGVARLAAATFKSEVSPRASSVTVTWAKSYGDLVLRQQGVDEPFTGLLAGGSTSEAINIAGGQAQSSWQAFVSYIPVGFDHILPKGLDHILFVLGLFFLSMGLRALIWQVSAFTLAHTVTLAMGALGWIVVPGSIVEPLIAASIVYVGIENVFSRGLTPWRPVVVFGFGLLHGLGFASVLGDFGLPAGQFIPALLGFNIGVEVGQLTVIAIAFLAVGLWFGQRDWYRSRIAIPASLAISAVGAYWVIERTLL